MAAYSYGSSYEAVMKKNCGYRQLGNYYNNLFDNVTQEDDQGNGDNGNSEKIVAVPVFGQSGYNNITPQRNSNLMSSGGNGNGNGKAAQDGVQCNTWRRGQCCDGRSLNKDAYTQCANGVCSFYKDMRDPANQLFSRY